MSVPGRTLLRLGLAGCWLVAWPLHAQRRADTGPVGVSVRPVADSVLLAVNRDNRLAVGLPPSPAVPAPPPPPSSTAQRKAIGAARYVSLRMLDMASIWAHPTLWHETWDPRLLSPEARRFHIVTRAPHNP